MKKKRKLHFILATFYNKSFYTREIDMENMTERKCILYLMRW